ncbi:MAG: hypothetical protein IT163_05195 [Bryobacterales bacterium]|nr:hypothetical protein [Bryobacterales bacterium]
MHRTAVRLLGRLAEFGSYSVAGIFLLFVIGEFLAPHSGAPSGAREWFGILLITVACCAPVYGLRHELGAAATSLIALALFCLMTGLSDWRVAGVIALPGALHLLHALLDRSDPALPAAS